MNTPNPRPINNPPQVVHLQPGDALIVVDVQNDFLPGGSLAVPHGDEVVAVLNRYIAAFQARSLPVYATRDWHPADHCSFQPQGGPWPPHCIANTPGAQFAAGLQLLPSATIISKATQADKDAYSGFEGTDLDARLRAAAVKRLFIGGLATDYCVFNTVKDARSHGYQVFLLEDAIRAVNVQPNDGVKAERAMIAQGAVPVERKMLS
ncbi:MAG: isochorismatase family protein [Gammaproteobacteria bacterium]|nr:isochorismatase family protein [Gammaproteobacteria bacterium]